ncbi:hypothetical protein ACFVGY_08435 [Streptomyces sp. NPDC127106]|uniref:hypothetical protein n=1 Tax=Streptomyces sp. NPDC127106 TaxID=3345360 RepID=UPI00362BEA8E
MTTDAQGAAVAALTLGYGRAWLTIESRPELEDGWLLTADSYKELSARFEVEHVEREYVVAFVDRLITGMADAESFSVRLTPGRNNPLTLRAVPVEDGFEFLARLTPNGDDAVVHLDMEVGNLGADELRADFENFRRNLA